MEESAKMPEFEGAAADTGYTRNDVQEAREAGCKMWGHVSDPQLINGRMIVNCERCGHRIG